MDCAWAIETNGSAKTFQSIDCAVVAAGNSAARAIMMDRAVLLVMVVRSFNSEFWKHDCLAAAADGAPTSGAP
jgi:hypothetical protein